MEFSAIDIFRISQLGFIAVAGACADFCVDGVLSRLGLKPAIIREHVRSWPHGVMRPKADVTSPHDQHPPELCSIQSSARRQGPPLVEGHEHSPIFLRAIPG